MMGWRESYAVLVELFPQVDVRLIKGAALEHGNDVGEAAEFILSEVLIPDECIPEVEQQPHPSHRTTNGRCNRVHHVGEENVQAGHPKESERYNGKEGLPMGSFLAICTEPGSDLPTCSQRQSEGLSVNNLSDCTDGQITPLEPAKVFEGKFSDLTCSEMTIDDGRESRVELPSMKIDRFVNDFSGAEMVNGESRNSSCPNEVDAEHLNDFTDSRVWKQDSGISSRDLPVEADKHGHGLSRGTDNIEVASVGCDFGEGHQGRGLFKGITCREANQEYMIDAKNLQFPEDVIILNPRFAKSWESGICKDSELKDSPQETLAGTEMEVPAASLDSFEAASHEQKADTFHAASMKVAVSLGSDKNLLRTQECNESVLEILTEEEKRLTEHSSLGDTDNQPPMFDSINVPRLACGDKGFELDSSLHSMLSMEGSFVTTNAVDGGNWESVERDSVNLTRMDTLDGIVEEAKADKEVLIGSIEEIRFLRQKSDQAEDAARQSKHEAARGGLDVLSKVDELRQMLSRAREANAMHAGEIYGEKAVLATEARELQSRLQQVKQEKAKALFALNEIKASLQARIDIANQECEAAELEKSAKESRAREALAKEEALVARVAQESRDLDAESEICTKIREFLIDRGSIVDALQGEVAVLCEDAEVLKRKDVDGMSLSCSGGYVHMLAHGSSDVFGSSVSESEKLTEFDERSLRSAIVPDTGSFSTGDNSTSADQDRVEKPCSVKKSWSPLPSLLGALSGSQDLSNSSHSGLGPTTGKNSAGSSRRGIVLSPGDDSQHLSVDDIKYPSSQSSTTSPGIAQAEQELYEAQMAIFSGENHEVEYSGSCSLDIFRSEKPNEPNAGTDEEDWQVLDPGMLRKLGSGRSSNSSVGD